MNTVAQQVPGTASSIRLPAAWRTSADSSVGLLAIEDVSGRFATSLTATLDPTQHALPQEPGRAAAAMLVTPLLLDEQVTGERADLLLCHLAGGVSATARQRQIVVPEGLLVLTFTAATSRWTELADLAAELLDSLEPTS